MYVKHDDYEYTVMSNMTADEDDESDGQDDESEEKACPNSHPQLLAVLCPPPE